MFIHSLFSKKGFLTHLKLIIFWKNIRLKLDEWREIAWINALFVEFVWVFDGLRSDKNMNVDGTSTKHT